MKKKLYQTDSFKVGIGMFAGIVLYKIVMAILSR
jgi:hypothetical protein